MNYLLILLAVSMYDLEAGAERIAQLKQELESL